MFRFNNDYNEMCHSKVLSYLTQFASEQMPGYGTDCACENAASLIRKACNNQNIAVHFLVGGTQTNLTVIASALRPHQGVIAPDSGHIFVHETGAIEATGHKVISVNTPDGKLTAAQIDDIVTQQRISMDAEHFVQPKMVYISNPTEFGTSYTLSELKQISDICKKNRLYLYVDGARLGYGLTAQGNDITLEDMANLTDAFYIGGTKCGTMFGEAVVITEPAIGEDFRYMIKQRGGMLAKGWLIGRQFEALFTDNLYFDICKQANVYADQLRDTLRELGFQIYVENHTNQVFVTLPDILLAELSKDFAYANWEKAGDNHTVVRFCTSWATTQEQVSALCDALKYLARK